MMAKKKRHHYLPKFYLNGFVDPDNKPYIWVYEKGNPTIKKATPRDIAVEKHYYSFTTLEGNKDSETFENILSIIEGHAAPIFEKVKNHQSLDEEERVWFAAFLALTMTRVPNFRKNIEEATVQIVKKQNMIVASDRAWLKSKIEDLERETGKKIEVSVEDLQRFILSGQYDIKLDPQFSLRAISIAVDIIPLFYKMSWSFLEATKDYKFVTSDNPIFYIDPTHNPKSFYGIGLANRNIELTFPVSKDLMFLGTWSKEIEGYKILNNKFVKELNRRTISSALRFVFSSQYSKELNRLVQKYKDSSPRMIVG